MNIFQFFYVSCQNFRIIGDDRTIIAVLRGILIDIISHTRIENAGNALFQQPFDMAVHHFCRIADCIARYGVAPFLKNSFIINGACNNFKTKLCKEGVPKRQKFINVKAKRQAYFAAPAGDRFKCFQ